MVSGDSIVMYGSTSRVRSVPVFPVSGDGDGVTRVCKLRIRSTYCMDSAVQYVAVVQFA